MNNKYLLRVLGRAQVSQLGGVEKKLGFDLFRIGAGG